MRQRLPVWLRCFGLLGWSLAVVGFAVSNACTNDAHDIDTCKQLEDARCHRAPGCNIDLSDPVHRTGTDVSSCIRYYDVACEHGLETSTSPSSTQVSQCLTAINQASCDIVETPQNDPRCAWLIPSTSDTTDAGEDADASDAADASDDADAAD